MPFIGRELLFLVGVEVVAPVRQAEPALDGVGDGHGRVLEIRFGTEAEGDAFAARRGGFEIGGEAGGIGDRVDLGETGGERCHALRFDGGLVHARGPQIADDLLDPPGAGGRRGLLGELMLHGQRPLAEHRSRPPAAAIGRNRIGRQPLRVDVAAEIDAGIFSLVEVARREAQDRRELALVESGSGARRWRRRPRLLQRAGAGGENERTGEGEMRDREAADFHATFLHGIER